MSENGPPRSDPPGAGEGHPERHEPRRTAAPDRVQELFLEFLEAHDAGAKPDVEAYLERAGPARERLATLLATLSEVTPREPVRFGRFLVLETIRAGGQGRVYLASDPELGRQVALKVIDDSRLDRLEREWVLNEARSIAKLDHPGIVRVFDVGQEDGRAFIVMEHLEGPSLAEVIRGLRGEPCHGAAARATVASLLPVAARLRCLARLGEALAFCHARGVLHRDITPSNVLFGRDGEPRFIDFGLAHVDSVEAPRGILITQRLTGTPGYMAPEQLDHQRTGSDPRSDQFAFGVLCYELLTTRRPFVGATVTQINAAVLAPTPPRRPRNHSASIPPSAERVVMHALEKDPNDRYRGLSELADDLRAILADRPISVDPPTLARRLTLWARRNRRRIGGAAVVGLLVLGVLLALGLADYRRRVLDVSSRLSSIPREGHSPVELAQQGRALERLLPHARELERSWARVLFPSGEEAVRRAHDQWSERCAAAYEAALLAGQERGLRFQSDDWSELTAILRTSHPEIWERLDHRRLILPSDLPEGSHVRLFEQVLRSDFPGASSGRTYLVGYVSYLPIPMVERPVEGTYRLGVWLDPRGAPAFEYDFRVEEARRSPIRVEYRPPDAATRAGTLAVAETVVDFPTRTESMASVVEAVTVPAFRISPAFVTHGAFQRFVAATGHRASVLSRSDDSPAWVGLADALAYSHWVGGRLPTALELYTAHVTGICPLPERGPLGHGEWVTDQALGVAPEQPAFLQYAAFWRFLQGDPTLVLPLCVLGLPDIGVPEETLSVQDSVRQIGTSFRIVFGDQPMSPQGLEKSR